MKRIVLSFLPLCGLIAGDAQVLQGTPGTAYTGLGVYSAAQADVFSFSVNQASLAQLKTSVAGIQSERRFLLKELTHYAASMAITTPGGNFGLKGVYSGTVGYNQTQLGLAYARQLGSKLDAGVQFNYNGIGIAGYGHASAASFEIGTVVHLTSQLHAGIHVNNPVGGAFGKDGLEKLSAVYTAGIGYEASPQFLGALEITKEENRPVGLNAGIQYRCSPQLFVRAGIAGATSSVWMGVGLLWQAYRVDLISYYHPQLGITPGLLIAFNFKKKEA